MPAPMQVTPTKFMDLETGDDSGFLKNSLKAYLERYNDLPRGKAGLNH